MNQYEKTPLEKRMAGRREHQEELHTKRETILLRIRNVLNLIFMVGAIVGVIYYVSADKQTGIYIILGAMVFKIMESAIRILRI